MKKHVGVLGFIIGFLAILGASLGLIVLAVSVGDEAELDQNASSDEERFDRAQPPSLKYD